MSRTWPLRCVEWACAGLIIASVAMPRYSPEALKQAFGGPLPERLDVDGHVSVAAAAAALSLAASLVGRGAARRWRRARQVGALLMILGLTALLVAGPVFEQRTIRGVEITTGTATGKYLFIPLAAGSWCALGGYALMLLLMAWASRPRKAAIGDA